MIDADYDRLVFLEQRRGRRIRRAAIEVALAVAQADLGPRAGNLEGGLGIEAVGVARVARCIDGIEQKAGAADAFTFVVVADELEPRHADLRADVDSEGVLI